MFHNHSCHNKFECLCLEFKFPHKLASTDLSNHFVHYTHLRCAKLSQLLLLDLSPTLVYMFYSLCLTL